MSGEYTRSELRRAFGFRSMGVEDFEDDTEVVDLESSHNTNNTMDSTAVGTYNEQSNKPTAHTSMKRKSAQKPLAPEDKMARASSREKTPGNHEKSANETSDLSTGRQSLFGGPFKGTNDMPNGHNFWETADRAELIESPLDNITRATSPSQSPTHNFTRAPAQPPVSHTTTRTSTPRASTTTSSSSSKVSKSNPTHIELFKTLSPSQKLGRRNKMNSIRNKLKQKTVDELTQIYNSTEDPDFRKLMSEVYYENCMERLDDWEAKL